MSALQDAAAEVRAVASDILSVEESADMKISGRSLPEDFKTDLRTDLPALGTRWVAAEAALNTALGR